MDDEFKGVLLIMSVPFITLVGILIYLAFFMHWNADFGSIMPKNEKFSQKWRQRREY